MANRGLGRGLNALLGDDAGRGDPSGTLLLPLSEIEPNRAQPRKTFDEERLMTLKESIVQNGVITPITVRRLSSGRYQIIAGERRWRAAKMAGLSEIPAMVLEADDRQTMVFALIENLQREDLDPIEEAKGYHSLMEDFGMTQEDIAAKVGKSRPAIANALRLLQLPDVTQEALKNGEISVGHARALIGESEAKQKTMLARIRKEALSVRETEQMIREIKAPKNTSKRKKSNIALTARYEEDLERKLTAKMGRRVRIISGKQKGKIELEYYGNDDLEVLIDRLLRGK